jgi:hypothetical protein
LKRSPASGPSGRSSVAKPPGRTGGTGPTRTTAPSTSDHSFAWLSAADKWREEGKNLRRQLAEERSKIAARLAEIDKRLAQLPPETLEPPFSNDTPLGVLGNGLFELAVGASIPHMVASIVRHSPRPLSAGEIVKQVQDSRTGIKAEMVHSAIYRLKERGEIEPHGDKGSRTFTWKGAKEPHAR